MASVVEEISSLNFTGDVIPISWYEHIKTDAGKPDTIAIMLLADIIYWYRAVEVRDEATGKLVGYRKKFKGDKLQKSYSQFADYFGFSKEQVRRAMKRLQQKGLITIEFRTLDINNMKLVNVMFVEPVPEKIREITSIGNDISTDEAYVDDDPYVSKNLQGGVCKFADTSMKICTDKYIDYNKDYKGNNIYICAPKRCATVQHQEHSILIEDETEQQKDDETTSRKRYTPLDVKPPFRSVREQEMFRQFWKEYPKKKSKGQAEKVWAKIHPDEELFPEIMAGLARAKQSKDWRRNGGQFIPYPATWLNARGWEDEDEESFDNNLGYDRFAHLYRNGGKEKAI